MHKFFLMIFSVSIFFIGLGGVVNQISAKFNSRERTRVIVSQNQINIPEHEQTKSVRSITFIGKSKKRVTVNDEKTETPPADFLITVPPHSPDKIIEFRRQLAPEPLPHEVEIPRINEKDTIIFLNKDDAESRSRAQ